jgi:predicted exporter
MRRPGRAWGLLVGIPVVLAIAAADARIDLSFAGLMNREDPEIAAYFERSQAWGLGGRLALLVEGPSEQLDAAVEAVRTKLVAEPSVRRAMSLGGAGADAEEGARLLVVVLARDSFELGLDEQPLPRLEAIAAAELSRLGARGAWAGLPAVVEEDQTSTLRRIAWLSPLSLVLALGLVIGVERRLVGLLAIAAPMVLAAVGTIAVVALATGRITLMESLFGVLVFGLGVDFAIHLGLRALEERRAGHAFEDAVARAYASAGPGVVAGAATTAGAFAVAATAPEPTFVHLGITGALGVLACCLAMLVGLPAAWALAGKRVPGERSGEPAPGSASTPRGLERVTAVIAGHAIARPRLHLSIAALVVALASLGLARLRYEQDLANLVNGDVRAVATAERIQARFGIDGDPWVLPARDLEEARAFEASLMATGMFSSVRSAASLPMPVDRLPEALRAELVAPDGRLLVYAMSTHAHLDAARARAEREAARSVSPEASSLAVLLERVLRPERPWLPGVIAGVVALLVAVLWIDLRRPRWIALALLPVSLGCAFTFGVLGWLGVPLNTVALLGAPLVLGLGIDDGIHVVHRLRQVPADALLEDRTTAVASVGRAIALTTATTCASFATLVLSGHAGLASMGIVMLVALPACWLASCSTLPAAARAWAR